MRDFSIESEAERIVDPRSRELFREVLSSFVDDHTRSATVMLWTVVVCDIIYKLQHLRDVDYDPVAKSILDEIDKQQQQNPHSPTWEIKLLEQIKDKTTLIDNAEFTNLVHIQKMRHLSAHPILQSTDLLYSPNRETCRACIRNALEIILLKPPFFTRNIVDHFLKDLAETKNLLPDERRLASYIEAKYLPRLIPAIENQLFRSLWKLTFRLSNPDTDQNRDINLRAICYLFKRRPAELSRLIEDDNEFFSYVGEGEPLEYLARFLSLNPSIYKILSNSARIPLQSMLEANSDLYINAWFLHGSMLEHIKAAKAKAQESPLDISREAWTSFLEQAESEGLRREALNIGIEKYIHSWNFDTADVNFSYFVRPHLDELDSEQIIYLLESIEQNDQTYNRGRADHDHAQVKKKAVELIGNEFDSNSYPNFENSILESSQR